MRKQSLPGSTRIERGIPGSQAIGNSFGNQDKPLLNHLFGAESAAEHLRNALQILNGLTRQSGTRILSEDVDRLRYRIETALELVESPAAVAELEQLPRLDELWLARAVGAVAVNFAACKYCGCQQDSACSVRVDQLVDEARDKVEHYYRDRGDNLPDVVPCWWVSLRPAVCSAPACLNQFRAAQLATRPPEWGGPL